MKKLFLNKWFLLLYNTIVFALFAWLLPIHFEENDDVTMCMIANGICSGKPDGHFVYINAMYGWVIAGLYMLSDSLEWYTLAFCVLHVIAMTGIVYIVVKDDTINSLLKGTFVAFMYVLWARIVIAFQFTTTAGLLCFSGCLALHQLSRKWRMLGVIAIFVASLVRFSAAALVGIVFAPVLVADAFKERRMALWLVGLLLLVLIGKWADGWFYNSPEWSAYRAYDSVRGSINDNPNAALALLDLPDGVEEQDYQMFRSFEGDPKIMSLPKILKIQEAIRKNITIRQAWSNMSQLKLFRIPLALLAIGVAVCAFKGGREKGCFLSRSSGLLVVSFLFSLVLVFYVAATDSLKNRVFLCWLIPMSYLLVCGFRERDDSSRNGFMERLLPVVLVMGLLMKYGYQNVKVINKVRSQQKEFNEWQLPLVAEKNDIIYPGAFRYEFLPPFEISGLKFRMVGLGWMTCIPFQRGILESHSDFVDSDIVYFGHVSAPPVHLLERIQKNYGYASTIETVECNEKYALFKFVSE